MATTSKYILKTLLFFLLSWTRVSSVIYKSVMWTTNNPYFQNRNNSKVESFCYGGDLEMNVELKSVLPVICPFEDLIMQTLESQPSSGILNENIWIVYDKKSYDDCIVNTTATFGGGRTKLKNKILFKCDTPDTLNKHVYRIDFKEDGPVSADMYFEANTTYYFLATSDGQKSSLDKTSGGHCNNDGDNEIRMKFRVYVCGTNALYKDPKCDSGSIGKFRCVRSESSTSPPPTSSISPSLTVSTSLVSSTSENSESSVCSCHSVSYNWVTSTVVGSKKGTWNGSLMLTPSTNTRNRTVITTPSSNLSIVITTSKRNTSVIVLKSLNSASDNNNVSQTRQFGNRKSEDPDMRKSRDNWMIAAVLFMILFVVVLITMAFICYRLKRKKKVPCMTTCQIGAKELSQVHQNTNDKDNLVNRKLSHYNSALDIEDGSKKNKDTSQSNGVEKTEKKTPPIYSDTENGSVKTKTNKKSVIDDDQSKKDGVGTIVQQTRKNTGKNDKIHIKKASTKLPPIPSKSQEVPV